MDILDRLKAWIRTGVLPLGAHVRWTEGRCETPLSSGKKTQALWRRAFCLLRANVVPARV